MDEESNSDKKIIKLSEIEKNKIKLRDISPLPNIENNNQKEISSKMNKILSIMYDDNFVIKKGFKC